MSKFLTPHRRNILRTALLIGGILLVPTIYPTSQLAASPEVAGKTIKLRGIDIFYREAGPKDGPTILLLHGFPSSSHMFRDLIPKLATKFRVLAPDYPGFGDSAAPPIGEFPYTFAAMADLVDEFTQAVGAKSYLIYMQDYGGPVGFRLAAKHPGRVRGLIIQNAVANEEAWSPDIAQPLKAFWKNRNAETETTIRGFLSAETTKFQYIQGATRSERLSSDAWTHDQARLDRPGNAALQLEMLYNYQDNFTQYPKWGAYLKANQPPMLIAWGKNDPFFTLRGVEYLKAQVPGADIHLFDAGHFALETHAQEIASLILNRF